MAAKSLMSTVSVVDSDTHVVEPPDLWTARLPKRFLNDAPKVAIHPERDAAFWRLPHQGVWLTALGQYCRQPHAHSVEELDPRAWDPVARLKRMDEFGIRAQVLYPNLISFEMAHFLAHDDPEYALACTRAYNDWLIEFSSADSSRYVPIAIVPFWDVQMALNEIARCKDSGHKGLLWSGKLESLDLPGINDPHWDPIYTLAQDLDMSLNLHIGAAQRESLSDVMNVLGPDAPDTASDPAERERIAATMGGSAASGFALTMLSNANAICQIVTTDLCERFPRLKFVSVESGFGYLPWLLDGLDWFFSLQLGGPESTEGLLPPSEYFRRQCYGSFWFETSTLSLLELYPDNFMFETDYPHPISLSPGPDYDVDLQGHVESAFRDIAPDVTRKALRDNAARVYRLDA